MKKILWAIIAAVVLTACSGRKSYKINGILDGVEDGTVVTLVTIEDGTVPNALDSAVVNNGKFQMKGVTDTCQLAFLAFDVNGEFAGCQFFLESGKINIAYNAENALQMVFGTPSNDAFQNFYEVSLQFDEKIKELQDKLQMTIVTGGDGHEIVDELNEMQEKFKALVASSISDNCDNMFGYQQMLQYFDFFEPEDDLHFLQLLLPKYGSDYAFLNMSMQLKRLLPTIAGNPFIDFSANVLDRKYKFDKMANLSDYVKENKLVYLVFWSSYVPLSSGNIADLKAAIDKFGSKGFQIVCVSVDEDTQEWINAVKESEMTWPQLWNGLDDENSAASKYAVNAIPLSFLIDSDGLIRGRNIQFDELDLVLNDFFK